MKITTKREASKKKNYTITKNNKMKINIQDLPDHILELIVKKLPKSSIRSFASTSTRFNEVMYYPSIYKERKCILKKYDDSSDELVVLMQPCAKILISKSTLKKFIPFQMNYITTLSLTDVTLNFNILINIINYSPKLKFIEIDNCKIEDKDDDDKIQLYQKNIKVNYTIETFIFRAYIVDNKESACILTLLELLHGVKNMVLDVPLDDENNLYCDIYSLNLNCLNLEKVVFNEIVFAYFDFLLKPFSNNIHYSKLKHLVLYGSEYYLINLTTNNTQFEIFCKQYGPQIEIFEISVCSKNMLYNICKYMTNLRELVIGNITDGDYENISNLKKLEVCKIFFFKKNYKIKINKIFFS